MKLPEAFCTSDYFDVLYFTYEKESINNKTKFEIPIPEEYTKIHPREILPLGCIIC